MTTGKLLVKLTLRVRIVISSCGFFARMSEVVANVIAIFHRCNSKTTVGVLLIKF